MFYLTSEINISCYTAVERLIDVKKLIYYIAYLPRDIFVKEFCPFQPTLVSTQP
jgi:hypothetical protein